MCSFLNWFTGNHSSHAFPVRCELLGQMSSRTAVTTLDGALGDMQISQLLGSKTVWPGLISAQSIPHWQWRNALRLTLNIPSLARQRCLPSWGPRRTPWFFCNFSNVWCGRLFKLCFLGFWNYNSVIQALSASNILCLFISTQVTGGTELLHTHSSLIQHLNNVIFWALSAGHFSNLQRSEPKNNKNNNISHL